MTPPPGDPNIRTFDPSSFAQQAVTYLCLDFNSKSSRSNEMPKKRCPSGIRSQIVRSLHQTFLVIEFMNVTRD